jgi:hypothetical protein
LENTFKQLFNKYGSDKSDFHSYHTIYEKYLSHLKNEPLNLFECGIGSRDPKIPSNMAYGNYKSGGSLRDWRDYFPNAQIYGADIDIKCLFEEERIKTFYIDQLNDEIIKTAFSNLEIQFDIMVDDGVHHLKYNYNLFKNSFEFLKNDGLYFIEDVKDREANNYLNQLGEYNPKIERGLHGIGGDDNIIVIKK